MRKNRFNEQMELWLGLAQVSMRNISEALGFGLSDLLVTFPPIIAEQGSRGAHWLMNWTAIQIIEGKDNLPLEGQLVYANEPTTEAFKLACIRSFAFQNLVASLEERDYIQNAIGAYVIDSVSMLPAMFKSHVIAQLQKQLEEHKELDLETAMSELVKKLVDYSRPHLEMVLDDFKENQNAQ